MERFTALIGFFAILVIAYADVHEPARPSSGGRSSGDWCCRSSSRSSCSRERQIADALRGDRAAARALGRGAGLHRAWRSSSALLAKRLPRRRAQRRSGSRSASSRSISSSPFNLLAFLFETHEGRRQQADRLHAGGRRRSSSATSARGNSKHRLHLRHAGAADDHLHRLDLRHPLLHRRDADRGALLRQGHVALHGRVRRGVDVGRGVDLHGTDRGAADHPPVPAGR